MRRLLSLVGGLLLWAACPTLATADTERILLTVGSKHGLVGEWPLAYAESDAARFARVMVELGQVAPEHVIELYDPSSERLIAALRQAASGVRGSDLTLIVFFSGHGSETALHLRGQSLPLARLRQELENVQAKLRLLVIDACRGSFARKGFGKAETFTVQLSQPEQHRGLVVLSAAGSGEDALESNELRSGVFTHHLLSALRGAADQDADGRVSLYEAYDYAYASTLKTSAQANVLAQHPTLDLVLEGNGPLVLTRLAPAKSVLVLPGAIDYRYIVFQRGSDAAVAEVNTTRLRRTHLALPAGQFVVYRSNQWGTSATEVTLPFGGTKQLDPSDFRATAAAAVASKGGYSIYPHAFSVSMGAAATLSDRAGPQARLGYEWRSGAWATTLALAGSVYELRSEQAGSRVAVELSSGLEYRVPLGGFTVGAGAGIAAGWLRQALRERAGRGPDVDTALALGAFAVLRLLLPISPRLGWQLAASVSEQLYLQDRAEHASGRIVNQTALGVLSGALFSF